MVAPVIALEGPSLSGKTTLSSCLLQRLSGTSVVVCPDYVDFAGGPEHVPSTPRDSVAAELESFRFFLGLDEARWLRCVGASCDNPVILDRSIHTLLAHTFAIESVTGRKVFEDSCTIAATQRMKEPDLVLYLDVSGVELERRAARRATYCDPLFKQREYNDAFRSYFLPRLRWGSTEIHVLDDSNSEDAIEIALGHLRKPS